MKRCSALRPASGPPSYFLGRETVLPTGPGAMARWRKQVFAFLHTNASSVTEYFQLPPNRVVELGAQLEL